MIPQQLDLFGGPLKPPKKIKVDDEPVAEVVPATDPIEIKEETEAVEIVAEENAAPAFIPSDNIEPVTEIERDESSMVENFENENLDSLEVETTAESPILPDEEIMAEELEDTSEATLSTPQRGRKPIHEYDDESDNLNVPPDEELFKRQYYSMRETAAMFGVNQSLLRFWENEFDILEPKKNKKGDRYFRPVDVKNLVMIYHLLRVRKFTLGGAKEYLQSHKKAGDSFELITKLEKLKSFLLELKANL